MVNFLCGIQMSPKKFNVSHMLVFIVLVVLFSLTVYFGALLLSDSSESSQPSVDYTVLTLVLYQSTQYQQGDIMYEFSYVLGGQGRLLHVYSEGQSISYVAVPGAVHNVFDLKITIYSANEKMLVLHIIPIKLISE